MDASTISAIFPYMLGAISLLGGSTIALCGWFVKKMLDDNNSLKCELSKLKQSCDDRYEGLQVDNTKIKLELEHIHGQLDITTSELHSIHIQNNLEHVEFYERIRSTELSHNTLLVEHNCIKDIHK